MNSSQGYITIVYINQSQKKDAKGLIKKESSTGDDSEEILGPMGPTTTEQSSDENEQDGRNEGVKLDQEENPKESNKKEEAAENSHDSGSYIKDTPDLVKDKPLAPYPETAAPTYGEKGRDFETDKGMVQFQQDIAAPKEEEKIEAAVSTENPTLIDTSKAVETPVNDQPIVQSTKEDMDLSITVVSCRGLLVGDLESSDPYVKLYLDGKVIHETKYIKNT